jgi:hypothetical protein
MLQDCWPACVSCVPLELSLAIHTAAVLELHVIVVNRDGGYWCSFGPRLIRFPNPLNKLNFEKV